MKKFIVILAFAAMVFTLSSCDIGSNPSSLVGQWEHASGAKYNKPEDIELFKDGTGLLDKKASISWKVENKRLVMLSSQIGYSCNYKVSGYELTLDYDDGTSAIFVKKGKLEEFKAKQAAEKAKAAVDPTNPESIRKHYAKMQPPIEMSENQFVSYVLNSDTANMNMFLTYSKDYLNKPNSKGNTALSLAVNRKNAVMVKYLLSLGADLHIKSDQLGLTPLEDAATRADSLESGIFSMLIKAQKVKDPALMNIGTALHMAARYGALKNVELLIENGANPNAKSLEGYTPLHEAAKEGKKTVVEYLISKNVDVNALDKEGYTPIDWAEAMGPGSTFPEVAKVLQKAGGKHTAAWRAAF